MKDKIFLDSNILLYSQGIDSLKKNINLELLEKDFFISTQVLGEFINVRIKKFKDDKANAFALGHNILEICSLIIIKPDLYKTGERICVDYGYSFYDSMIIAAALESECATLYTEDLSHNQLIESKLRIVNSFL